MSDEKGRREVWINDFGPDMSPDARYSVDFEEHDDAVARTHEEWENDKDNLMYDKIHAVDLKEGETVVSWEFVEAAKKLAESVEQNCNDDINSSQIDKILAKDLLEIIEKVKGEISSKDSIKEQE